ncbi:hypothetical protein ACJX0J_036620 [Zea mays]
MPFGHFLNFVEIFEEGKIFLGLNFNKNTKDIAQLDLQGKIQVYLFLWDSNSLICLHIVCFASFSNFIVQRVSELVIIFQQEGKDGEEDDDSYISEEDDGDWDADEPDEEDIIYFLIDDPSSSMHNKLLAGRLVMVHAMPLKNDGIQKMVAQALIRWTILEVMHPQDIILFS